MAEEKGELQLEEDMVFQRREWRAERVVWVLMLLFVLAALMGATGKGGISTKERSTAHFKVEYERFVRRGSPDKIVITLLRPTPSAQKTRQLLLTTSSIEKISVENIVPEPAQMTTVPNGLLLTFSAHAPQSPSRVELDIEPAKIGNLHTVLRDKQTGDSLQINQFIYP